MRQVCTETRGDVDETDVSSEHGPTSDTVCSGRVVATSWRVEKSGLEADVNYPQSSMLSNGWASPSGMACG